MQTFSNDVDTDVYAGFFVRLVAFAIDCILVWIGTLFIKGSLFNITAIDSFMTTNVIFHYSIYDIVLYLLKAAYFVVCTYATGTTVGKYIMKLKVNDKAGENPSLFNVLYRETIGRFLSSILCIGYFLIIIDKEKCSIHDKLCNTRVVYSCKVIKQVRERPVPGTRPIYPVNPNPNGGQTMQNQASYMPQRPNPPKMPQEGSRWDPMQNVQEANPAAEEKGDSNQIDHME